MDSQPTVVQLLSDSVRLAWGHSIVTGVLIIAWAIKSVIEDRFDGWANRWLERWGVPQMIARNLVRFVAHPIGVPLLLIATVLIVAYFRSGGGSDVLSMSGDSFLVGGTLVGLLVLVGFPTLLSFVRHHRSSSTALADAPLPAIPAPVETPTIKGLNEALSRVLDELTHNEGLGIPSGAPPQREHLDAAIRIAGHLNRATASSHSVEIGKVLGALVELSDATDHIQTPTRQFGSIQHHPFPGKARAARRVVEKFLRIVPPASATNSDLGAPTASITIHSARFGILGTKVKVYDVTRKVQEMVNVGIRSISASHDIFGDPAHGDPKKLEITWSSAGRMHTQSCAEYCTIVMDGIDASPPAVGPTLALGRPNQRIWIEETVERLTQLYRDNTSAQADQLATAYIGKWMHIDGQIVDVRREGTDYKARIQRPDQTRWTHLRFSEAAGNAVSHLPKGQSISAAGRLRQISDSWVTLDDCELVDGQRRQAASDPAIMAGSISDTTQLMDHLESILNDIHNNRLLDIYACFNILDWWNARDRQKTKRALDTAWSARDALEAAIQYSRFRESTRTALTDYVIGLTGVISHYEMAENAKSQPEARDWFGQAQRLASDLGSHGAGKLGAVIREFSIERGVPLQRSNVQSARDAHVALRNALNQSSHLVPDERTRTLIESCLTYAPSVWDSLQDIERSKDMVAARDWMQQLTDTAKDAQQRFWANARQIEESFRKEHKAATPPQREAWRELNRCVRDLGDALGALFAKL